MYFSIKDISKLGTILGVWAHPDDETWSSAGIMAVAVANGQRVVCLTATRGDAGETADETKWPKNNLAAIRTKELEKALHVVGVNENYWLRYKDGQLKEVNHNEAIDQISEIISKVEPDTILTFEPFGITGHDDHCRISEWAIKAAKRAQSKATVYGATEVKQKYEALPDQFLNDKQLYFNIDHPKTIDPKDAAIYFELPESILDKKLQALAAHACQMTDMLTKNIDEVKMLASSECYIRLN